MNVSVMSGLRYRRKYTKREVDHPNFESKVKQDIHELNRNSKMPLDFPVREPQSDGCVVIHYFDNMEESEAFRKSLEKKS